LKGNICSVWSNLTIRKKNVDIDCDSFEQKSIWYKCKGDLTCIFFPRFHPQLSESLWVDIEVIKKYSCCYNQQTEFWISSNSNKTNLMQFSVFIFNSIIGDVITRAPIHSPHIVLRNKEVKVWQSYYHKRRTWKQTG
jgi:hypothetical protein